MTGQNTLHRPSITAAPIYCRHFHAKPFSPFLLSQRDSVQSQPNRATSVVQLFFLSLPAAVIGLVMAVVVYAAERMARRTFTHVGQERLETSFPSVAHRNPASAVVLVIRGGLCKTARLRCTPRSIFATERLPVCQFHRGGDLIVEASATAGIFGEQGISGNDALIAAITSAQPSGSSAAVASCSTTFNSDESPEPLTGQVSEFSPRHKSIVAQNRPVLTGEWPNELNT